MQKVATLKPNAETKRSFIATERSFILVALHIYVNTKKVAIINDFWGFNEKERSYLHPPAKQITQTNVPPAEQTRIPKSFTLRNNSNCASETNEPIICPAKW